MAGLLLLATAIACTAAGRDDGTAAAAAAAMLRVAHRGGKWHDSEICENGCDVIQKQLPCTSDRKVSPARRDEISIKEEPFACSNGADRTSYIKILALRS